MQYSIQVGHASKDNRGLNDLKKLVSDWEKSILSRSNSKHKDPEARTKWEC